MKLCWSLGVVFQKPKCPGNTISKQEEHMLSYAIISRDSALTLNAIDALTKKGMGTPTIAMVHPSLEPGIASRSPLAVMLPRSMRSGHGLEAFKPTTLPVRVRELIMDPEFRDVAMKLAEREDAPDHWYRVAREALILRFVQIASSTLIEKKVGLLISFDPPHFFTEYVLYRVAEALDIPCLIIRSMSIVPCVEFRDGLFGTPLALGQSSRRAVDTTDIVNKSLEDYVARVSPSDGIEEPHYMKKQKEDDRERPSIKDRVRHFKRILRACSVLLGFSYPRMPWGLNVETAATILARHTAIQATSNLKKYYTDVSQNFSLPDRYVYVALHYEPERTSCPDGGAYYDQFAMIFHLLEWLPEDVHVVVKEHPSQHYHKMRPHIGRHPFSYDVLKGIERVHIAPMSCSSHEMTIQSEAVACLTGTALLEALLLEITPLAFGYPWFLPLKGVIQFNPEQSYKEVIGAKMPTQAESLENLKQFVAKYGVLGACDSPGDEHVKRHMSIEEASPAFETAFVDAVRIITGKQK